jgi:SAM-dependent MidA family methyltransferase
VIDYGRESGALRDAATRMAGPALAYSEHRATSDLLGDPGGRDLTAHVDLTALRVAAASADLGHIASTTQAGLLAAAGIDGELQRLRSGPDATLEGALALRTALASLMDPRGMGGFAAELFSAGSPSDRMALSNPADPLPGTAAPIRRLV